MYVYSAVILKNVDADTVHTRVDLGFDVHMDMSLRLAGINAPEMSTVEGRTAAAYVAGVIPPTMPVTIHTAKDRREKYGRYLAWVILADRSCLNRTLVDRGMAVAYGNLPVDPPEGL